MPRTEKGSRAQYLPPRLQTQLANQWRPVEVVKRVNKMGEQVLVFNDSSVLDLQLTTSINIPSCLPVGSQYLTSELTTGISTTGVVQRGIADKFLIPVTPSSSSFEPFDDHCNPASDAISTREQFYLTGSEVSLVGEGFETPLWSKTKFEIDITPVNDSAFGIQNYTSGSSNYLMSYWNKDTRRYEGVGSGKEFSTYISERNEAGLLHFLSEKAIGFGAVLDEGTVSSTIVSASYLVCNPISNFGFPSSEKYEATSSCLIPMNRYISEPFLLEKVVLYFSGALNNHTYIGSYACISTFFILNQRGAQINNLDISLTYNSASVSLIPLVSSSHNLHSTRDLVTWMQISKNANSGEPVYDEGLRREATYNSLFGSAPLRSEFSRQFVVSGAVKSAIKYDQGYNCIINVTSDVNQKTAEYAESFNVSGRNLIGDNGRSFLNPDTSPTVVGNARFSSFWTSPITRQINKSYSKVNPYLLLPTDKLIFGWQLPYSYLTFNENSSDLPMYPGAGPALTASMNGVHKIIFYGSLLRDNKEFHESFEQSCPTDVVTVENYGI